MSSNKKIKEEMENIFGKKCFIEELGIRKKSDVKKDLRRFTGKCQRCIMDQLTYHHIIKKCDGGRATIENGALIRNINHIWFHRLPKEQQTKINKLFQEYKKQFYQELEVEIDDVDTGLEIDIAEMSLTDAELSVKKLGKYNRAEMKRNTRKMWEEFEK